MALRVIGAGVGRTGTLSLKEALERLLDEPCYHMMEVFGHPEHIPVWHAAARDQPVDWHRLLAGYAASVDWPGASFWPELVHVFPDALVVLSVRDPAAWWESADQTIFPAVRHGLPGGGPPFAEAWHAMVADTVASRFAPDVGDRDAAIRAFEAHNRRVRESVPAGRLLEWSVADGWEPLCRALGLPVPDEPFPRRNTRQEFLARRAGARASREAGS